MSKNEAFLVEVSEVEPAFVEAVEFFTSPIAVAGFKFVWRKLFVIFAFFL